jgi:hypothetical protein
MHSDIKSCVQYNNNQSEFSPCLIGVRQGENLSTFLFSINLSDLEKYFIELNGNPLELLSEQSVNELNVFIKLFVILYADDTVILTDTKEGVQNALNIFQSYCEIWKPEVNVNKTKVVIFSKGKIRLKYEFKLQNKTLEIVDSYSYLGLIFKYNGNFNETRKKLARQAQISLFSIYKSIYLQLKLFDAMVEPILLYGSEIWDYENIKIIEQVHLQFCKRILKVRTTTPNFMVYGELGRFPLEIEVKMRMVSYWNKLLQNEKLSNSIYRLLLSLKHNGVQTFKWLNHVESIFNDSGLGYIFHRQDSSDYTRIKLLLNQTLKDQFIQRRTSEMINSSRG